MGFPTLTFDPIYFRNSSLQQIQTFILFLYNATGVYSKYLKRWLKYFPRDQLLFVSGERLISDPVAEIGRVQDFLGLKRVINEKYFYFNSTKGFPCLLKSETRSTPRCLGKTKGRNHPHIDEQAIQRLREFYRPYNAKFYDLTGINFGWP